MIYLDSAATSFIKPPGVYRAVQRAMLMASSPGRGAYPSAIRAADLVYGCREAAARLFHMDDPSRVVITSSATHALNIAIRSLAKQGEKVLISGYEHNAVTRPLHAIRADVRVLGRKLFDPEALLKEFSENIDRADLVVCTHVSNVFGCVMPIDALAALCRRHRVPLIVDASQSAGLIDLDADKLGSAFIAMPGHKSLFGPQGTGLLLCGGEAEPLLYGGTGSESLSQKMPDALPERLEAGTMNVPGIAGLCAGIDYVSERGLPSIRKAEQRLLQLAEYELNSMPRVTAYCGPQELHAGIVSFSVDGVDSECFCELLGQRGIAARAGLHCAPLAHESAGTLACGTVRLSFSPFTDETQLTFSLRVIRDLLKD